jgi:cytochrome b6-f complex iron-sulfur subunit
MMALVRTLGGVVAGMLIVKLLALVSRLHEYRGAGRLTRRGFLRNTVLGSVVVVLVESAGGFVYFFWPNKTGAFGKHISVPAEALPAVGAVPYVNQPGKFYIINNDDGALALYWKCPHLGCTVPFNEEEDQWHCPCHGSIYNRHGERIAGPAPRPMDRMPMEVQSDGSVIIDTGTIVERSEWTPEQSVPLSG